jgi:predicted ATPase
VRTADHRDRDGTAEVQSRSASTCTCFLSDRVGSLAAPAARRLATHCSVETSIADAPLVARGAELERILSVLERACAGRGRLVFLAGEPGVGKTRLAREVLKRARSADAHVFSGSCFEQYKDVPFFPFTEPFADALVKAPPELQSVAAHRWPELAHLIPELGSQPGLEGHDTQLRVFRAASGFLLALAESQPIVWLLDDLHWADATSLGLVLHLARHIRDARILLLGTYRDIELAGSINWRRPCVKLSANDLSTRCTCAD